jgi:hypothetical protein
VVALVTVEQVKSLLNMDTDDHDAVKLPLLIAAASKAVINYLKGQADEVIGLDSGGDLPSGVEPPDEVVFATAYLVGYWFRHPDEDPEKSFERGYLPPVVTALLYPLRDPALA